jgi:hypothetical protein
MTDEQADILRMRMSQGRPTLLITVDKRTVSIDLDHEEVVAIADNNMERFSEMEVSKEDWSLAMCRFAEAKNSDGLFNGSAMLICNIEKWFQVTKGSWAVFHITKTGELNTEIAITNADPARLTDHLMHKPPNTIN